MCSLDRISILVLSLSLSIAASGCGTPPHRIELFAARPDRPSLANRSVAVLPALSVGTEASHAAVCTRAAEKMFEGEVAKVHFRGPASTVDAIRKTPEILDAIRQRVTDRLPASFGPDGVPETVFEGKVVNGLEHDQHQVVTLQGIDGLVQPLGPDHLNSGWLKPFDADYVLILVPFGYYEETTVITAIYGVLPFLGVVDLSNLTPRGVFLLYDRNTGQKVWESYIGTVRQPGSEESMVDSREYSVLGAAYLLTGNVEEFLARLLAVDGA